MLLFPDEEAEYIARWMALAFSKTDGCVYIATGKTVSDARWSWPSMLSELVSPFFAWIFMLQYAEDPEAHYLFQRGMLDRVRALPEGRYIANKPRTVIRALYGPGQRDRRIDADLVTPFDKHWNLFLERCGGKIGFKQRFGPVRSWDCLDFT